ncbi:MAG: bifunctional adenosylcobinamide kinase/adenosylcobinamide-phosphate guanylyltransferase [Peptococcaceae bacterium]|nr:bifunctional adenosylcobinamide kinase/adenosylcobinamide-phosphate guanylyltransferase [Peptococcaceae bacterium]MDH7524123.1 bifunctional adenosylcobinamide kinase/adenosylcobinamide-phosphate guanylyltransferase [Peptococcaceae bacterium]
MGKLIIVSGAARSGKSLFAEKLAAGMDKHVAYLATAQALDREMEERIERHKKRRPAGWQTFEEQTAVHLVIEKHHPAYKVWLLDCVTLYVSNLLFSVVKDVHEEKLADKRIEEYIFQSIDSLMETVRRLDLTLIAVTNEVGWGLVPPDPLSRLYRDVVGFVNQKMASHAEEVYLVALGIPVRLK